MDKPDVDHIDGLSPAISIDQKGASRNPRSTVGTITEIYDYLRLLFARVGQPHCPNCGREIAAADGAADRGRACRRCPTGSRIMILAPIIKDRKGEHTKVLRRRAQGAATCACASTARCTTSTRCLDLDRYKMHTIEVVVDRLVVKRAMSPALAERGGPGGGRQRHEPHPARLRHDADGAPTPTAAALADCDRDRR